MLHFLALSEFHLFWECLYYYWENLEWLGLDQPQILLMFYLMYRHISKDTYFTLSWLRCYLMHCRKVIESRCKIDSKISFLRDGQPGAHNVSFTQFRFTCILRHNFASLAYAQFYHIGAFCRLVICAKMILEGIYMIILKSCNLHLQFQYPL